VSADFPPRLLSSTAALQRAVLHLRKSKRQNHTRPSAMDAAKRFKVSR
jgi:hypothetical protein